MPEKLSIDIARAALSLLQYLEKHPIEAIPDAPERLRTRVIRPLGETDATDEVTYTSPEAGMWELAQAATAAAAEPGAPTAIVEAAAALQAMVPPERLPELAAAQSARPAGIQLVHKGPYLVSAAEKVVNHLGEPLPVRPLMALCRCGQSADKPYCDGTHATVDFQDTKDPKRVPNQRDTYVGQQVTVFDNRGICAHSGLCTDRLAGVFHAGGEPFVTPSGGRMDEIVRAVRDCPSGALSFAIDGREAREQVDQPRKPAITVTEDGPYRIVGGTPLVDDEGVDVPRNTGVSREHYSLCRCGHSQNKPFCSGMHYYVGFHDPVIDPAAEVSLFQWAGGYPALLRMTRIFYEKYVPSDPLVGPIFANMAADHPERVAEWLGEVFGGPKFYSTEHGGYSRMISQHVGKNLTAPQRARWVQLISQSAEDAGLPADAEFRAAFVAYLEWGSRIAFENSQSEAHPPPNMPMPRWWWVCNAEPRFRASALAPIEETPEVVLPGDDETVSFQTHIKPLFRSRDRESMRFAFDLWSYDDVKEHGVAILDQLGRGSMPCDGAWSKEQVQVLRRWTESGMSA
ncbi:hypothetical protein GCM10009765_48650 [Fodinicola feengrottensis]|uniref:Iron-binding zinc finger CDGSH type domain-containing protein n=1 Tax=Fodinicola feengrottensis TaxID=435914 RepID=A0ABN2HU91_9ACTN